MKNLISLHFLVILFLGFGFSGHIKAEKTRRACFSSANSQPQAKTRRRNSQLATQQEFRNHFPPTKFEFRKTYESFQSIVRHDQYFFSRIQSIMEKNGKHFDRKSFAKLFDISDEQNTSFLERFENPSEENIFFVLESSYLKTLNDEVIGKEDANSLNFFEKALLITKLFEVASTSSEKLKDPKLFDYFYDKFVSNESMELLSLKQNDYKNLMLFFELNEYSPNASRIRSILKQTYREHKEELQLLFKNELQEINEIFIAKKPAHIKGVEYLYNAVTADHLYLALSVLKESRNFKDPYILNDFSHGRVSLDKQKQKSFRAYFLYNQLLQSIFAKSNDLAEISETGEYYPKPILFKLLKRLAPPDKVARKDRTDRVNQEYFTNIKKLIENHFGQKLEMESVYALVEYYHKLVHLIPSMGHKRTEPITPKITHSTFFMSFDLVNGSGFEMHYVAKELAGSKNLKLNEKILRAKAGVDYTTKFMRTWSNRIEELLKKELAHMGIEVKVDKTGDDMLAIFSRIPSDKEIEKIKNAIAKHQEISNLSRITMGIFSPKEAILDEISVSESIEKAIEKTYYKYVSKDIPQMPRFIVHRIDGKFKLELLEDCLESQSKLILRIINNHEDLSTLNIELLEKAPEFAAGA
ncbi:MAG: hypothetical protein VX642_10555 [Bdellovibrionota bacterium]|nr:hypothetical protein [Bdellovibrionota bacterium]